MDNNDENENITGQQSLDDNAVTRAEQFAAGKALQGIQNKINDVANQAKKAAIDVAKKVGKMVAKVATNLLKYLIKLIAMTAPVSIIVIVALIIALLIIMEILSVYDGVTSVFKNDIKSGDTATLESRVSLYENSTYANSNTEFTVSANGDIATTAEQIHDYIRQKGYTYRNGNTMNYPIVLGQSDNSGGGIDCSTFVTWVLIMCGYTEFQGKHQLCTYDFKKLINNEAGYTNLTGKGWSIIEIKSDNLSELQPGDLLLKTSSPSHIEIFAGDGVGTYGAGSNHQIQATISYPGCSTATIVGKGNFTYAIRVPSKATLTSPLANDVTFE